MDRFLSASKEKIKIESFSTLSYSSIDKDKDGFISLSEIHEWMTRINKEELISFTELKEAWNSMMSCDENAIDYQSFKRFFKNIYCTVLLLQDDDDSKPKALKKQSRAYSN